MSAFADYLDLRLAVADHIGDDALGDVMIRLTKAAEVGLNRELRTRHQIKAATLTFASGAAPLPADFAEMIHVYNEFGHPMSASSLADAAQSGTQTEIYAIDATSVLINGFTGARSCRYYATLPTLTASMTTSNWLLQAHPNVYLYAVALEVAKFRKDVNLATTTATLLQAEIAAMKAATDAERWASGRVRLRGPAP